MAKVHPQPTHFEWQGLTRQGKRISGHLLALSTHECRLRLEQQGIFASSITKRRSFRRLQTLNAKDIQFFTRQLATLLEAGIPVIQALELIKSTLTKDHGRQLVQHISEQVQTGDPLSEACKHYPKYFSNLYLALVNSGEQSGTLARTLQELANYQEKQNALKAKLKKASLYPCLVLIVALLVTALLLVLVVPQFALSFQGLGAELPAFTLTVLTLSHHAQASWFYWLTAITACVFIFRYFYRSHISFKLRVDKAKLTLPLLGGILVKAASARFSRTLATTFGAGVPLIQALHSAAASTDNSYLEQQLGFVAKDVSSGVQLNQALQQTQAFPAILHQMVGIGEESGSLEVMLLKIANIYEREVDDALDQATTLLEPLIMLILAVLIGSLLVAMYLPIFKLGSLV